MSFTDALRTHKEQTERRRHRIFFDESFCNQFCYFNRTVPRRQRIEVVELTVRVTLGNLRSLEQPVGARRLQAVTSPHAFDTVSNNLDPAASTTARANLRHVRTHPGIVP